MNPVRLLIVATVAFSLVGCTPYDPGLRDWRGQVEITKKDSIEATDLDSNVSAESDSSVDVQLPPIIDSSSSDPDTKDSSGGDRNTSSDENSSNCKLDNATANRVEGVCVVVSCDYGYGDCDKDDSTGCETQLNNDDHCGACDKACEFEYGTGSCRAGNCELEECEPGFADCNDDPRDGCEASLDTWSHCGSCDNLCPMPETGSVTCENGECVLIECEPGWDSCTGEPDTFCETRIDTMDHCGSCLQRCSVYTSDHCEEGRCVCGELGRRCAMWECCWEEICLPWPCIPGI